MDCNDPCDKEEVLSPAAGAVVTLRPYDYLPEIAHLAKHVIDRGYDIWWTQTDDAGHYRFDSIPAGVYIIEAHDDNNNCVLIGNKEIDSARYFNNSDDNLLHEFRDTLRPPGTVTGTIQPADSSVDVYVRVFGLGAWSPVNPDGSFQIDGLPQGKLTLQFVTVKKDTTYDNVKVTTKPDSTTEIDTMVPSVYKVIYDGNGNTSGTNPVDGKWYETGEKLVINGNPGDLTKAGYTFAGWNTKVDGSGTSYSAGDTLVKGDGRATLYAQWAKNRYMLTVIGSGNGTVSGTDSVADGVPHVITATHDPGYHFSVWRVTSGTATIADSFADSTTVVLTSGDATVEGVFRLVAFKKNYGLVDTITGGYSNSIESVRQAPDGGYVLARTTVWGGPSIGYSTRVFKIDTSGTILWKKIIENTEFGQEIQPTNDGGTIIITHSNLVRIDVDGNEIWSNEINGTSVEQTNDGGYIVSGKTGAYNYEGLIVEDFTVYLVKTTASGDTLWAKSFKIPDSTSTGTSVRQADDGGYVVALSRYDGAGKYDIYLVRTDDNGDSIWTKTIGGSDNEYCTSVQPVKDGGYIIIGSTSSYGAGGQDIFLVKTGADGETEWKRTYGGIEHELGESVQPTLDGGFLITGSRSSEGTYIIKTDDKGVEQWTKSLDDIGASAWQCTDGGYVIAGISNGDGSLFLIKTDENGNLE